MYDMSTLVPTVAMHATDAAASTGDLTPIFVILVTLVIAYGGLMHVRFLQCRECGQKHRSDYCPACGAQ